MTAPDVMCHVAVHTSWGDLSLQIQGGLVREVEFPFLSTEPVAAFRTDDIAVDESDDLKEPVRQQVQQYFRSVFSGVAAEPPAFVFPVGSSFSVRVWSELQRIPAGSRISYGMLARNVGRPGAARAVGRACGGNPLPIIIPCHRVVAADGSLGGFSCGLPWKRLLLEVESRPAQKRSD